MLQIKLVGSFNGLHVEFHSQARLSGYLNHAVLDLQGILGEVLPILPNPVRVDGGHFARRCRCTVREHGQRHIEVIVGMRAPSEVVHLTQLRHPD